MNYGKISGRTPSECIARLRARFGDNAVIIRRREIRLKPWYRYGLFTKGCEIEYGVPEKVYDSHKPKSESNQIPLSKAKTSKPVQSKAVPLQNPGQRGNLADIGLGKFSYDSDDPKFARHRQRIIERLTMNRFSSRFNNRFLNNLTLSLAPQERANYTRVLEKSVETLAISISVASPNISTHASGGSVACMYLGPPGVGKTISLAKLASDYAIHQKRSVSIYSLDQFRLAATHQLRIYAKIVDIPFFAPIDNTEFAQLLERDGSELVFIDTFAIGCTDMERFRTLKSFVDVFEGRMNLQSYLVLSATMSADLIEKTFRTFDEQIGFEKVILTQLDETEFIGGFIEVADNMNKSFAYLMNGHQVPLNFERANAKKMAKKILGIKDTQT